MRGVVGNSTAGNPGGQSAEVDDLALPPGERVRCLRCLTGPLEEARTESFPASDWRHLEFNLRRYERAWRDWPAAAGRRARPDSGQASPPSKGREDSSATAVGDLEDTG